MKQNISQSLRQKEGKQFKTKCFLSVRKCSSKASKQSSGIQDIL